ncbi:MAG: hypothetical protein ABIF12_00510 [bacterium]
MNIKNLISIFILSCFIKLAFSMVGPQNYGQLPPPPSAEEIEEIMKSPEFQKMMEELEKIFEEEDTELPTPQQPAPKTIKKETPPETKPIISEKPKSKMDNFLEPVKSTSEKDKSEKIISKLTAEKIEAFNYFINKFTKGLDTIEKKINSFEFGIAFKEHMENKGFFKSINKINLAINQIRSKRLYQKIFFLPINTELRKEIINALKDVGKLEIEIKMSADDDSDDDSSEIETINFLQRIAANSDQITKIELSPLQKKLENLLNNNLKSIDKLITNVAVNTQVKEEIEKKKKLREKLEKDAVQKQSAKSSKSSYGSPYSSSGYGRGGGWQPAYGSGKKTYSGPGNWQKGYSPGHSPTKSSAGPQKPSIDSKPSDKKTPATSAKAPSEKIQEKLNSIKGLSEACIKLLTQIKGLFNSAEEENSLNEIYKSPLLTQLSNKYDLLEKEKDTLPSEIKSKLTEDQNLRTAISNFIPLGIKLAKNPGPESQRKLALRIIESQPETIKIYLKKYEEEVFKKLEGKEGLITSFDTPAQELKSIWRNLTILNTGRQENTKKIKAFNKIFEDQVKLIQTTRKHMPMGYINEITENIGQQNVPLMGLVPPAPVGAAPVGAAQVGAAQAPPQLAPAQPAAPAARQNLSTAQDLTNAINGLPAAIPDPVKTLFINKINPAWGVGQLTDQQQEKIKDEFSQITENISSQDKYLNLINKVLEKTKEED